MKKILITGKNSYIGTSFRDYLKQWPKKYEFTTISVREDSWKQHDFSQYNVVVHVAGIAHRRETQKNRQLYFEVNRDLAHSVAMKAKQDGVSQFVFLSSMSVYGIEAGDITINTALNPTSAYGKSKLEAERLISKLQDEMFNISILRPPMVYGPDCKGNYPKLAKIAKITPIFPAYLNKRSMIYIDNLSLYIKNIIDNNLDGVYLSQNKQYVNTAELVREISKIHNKKIYFTKIFNPLIKLFINAPIINKVFGTLVYVDTKNNKNIPLIEFEQSIYRTEENKNEE